MLSELFIRFLLGGLIVSVFAVSGDILRPKTFAGIFGAAPSVALASLGLTFITKTGAKVGIEARSMIVGAIALLCYSLLVSRLLLRYQWNTVVAAGMSWLVWLAVAFGLWALFLR